MNLKQIEGFCYLAQTLNFSKAAEMLYITQPAFSRMIVSLEEELGCQLFIRSKVKPQLTLAGEKIYRHMKSMMRDYEDIKGIAQLAEKDMLGQLRIGMLDNGMTECQREAILRFHNENPNITIEFKEYSEVEVFHALEMRWVDIAFIMHFPKILKEKIEGMVVETARECVTLNTANPLSTKDMISISELENQPFIMVRENKSEYGYNSIMSTCLENGFSPQIIAKVDSISGALDCIDCNLGISLIPDVLQPLAGKHVKFIPIKNAANRNIWMVWNKGDTNNIRNLFQTYMQKNHITRG